MPAPLGPTSATVSPGSARRLTPSSTRRGSPSDSSADAYAKLTFSNETAPRTVAGSGVAPGASAMAGVVSRSSKRRPDAPAAVANDV